MDYEGPFVFKNDFSALLDEKPEEVWPEGDALLRSEAVSGQCRVICFSPRHDLSPPEMEQEAISKVVDDWAEQTRELCEKYRWVQVFENKGSAMGCSNPHPHGQIWASDFLPNVPFKEDKNLRAYFDRTGNNMLLDYVERELAVNERIVCENDDWVTVVPYWAPRPFETLLLPKFAVKRLPELTESQRGSLADILKRRLTGCDNLFEIFFPYSMVQRGEISRNRVFRYTIDIRGANSDMAQ